MIPTREAVLLALAEADGQQWPSLTEGTTPHVAEVMYGKQANAMLALFPTPPTVEHLASIVGSPDLWLARCTVCGSKPKQPCYGNGDLPRHMTHDPRRRASLVLQLAAACEGTR